VRCIRAVRSTSRGMGVSSWGCQPWHTDHAKASGSPRQSQFSLITSGITSLWPWPARHVGRNATRIVKFSRWSPVVSSGKCRIHPPAASCGRAVVQDRSLVTRSGHQANVPRGHRVPGQGARFRDGRHRLSSSAPVVTDPLSGRQLAARVGPLVSARPTTRLRDSGTGAWPARADPGAAPAALAHAVENEAPSRPVNLTGLLPAGRRTRRWPCWPGGPCYGDRRALARAVPVVLLPDAAGDSAGREPPRCRSADRHGGLGWRPGTGSGDRRRLARVCCVEEVDSRPRASATRVLGAGIAREVKPRRERRGDRRGAWRDSTLPTWRSSGPAFTSGNPV